MSPRTEEPADEATPHRRRRPMGRRLLILVMLATVVGAGWWYLTQLPAEEEVAQPATLGRFADVVQTDLVELASYAGTLGRGDGDPVVNRAQGTLTSVVAAGQTVSQGDELYRVDDYPIILLEGDLPAWRQLRNDVDEGPDVEQLEAALVALGFDPDGTITVDEDFTSNTERMVERWQAELGVEEDGRVELGEVVFLPRAVRIAEVIVELGSPMQSGSQVVATSSAEIVVTIDLPTADQGILEEGDTVTVILPDDTKTSGTVTVVGTVATTDSEGNASVEVEVNLDDPTVAGNLDEAPVEIEVISDSVENAMAVPVTALVALSEGGYAVQLEDPDGALRYVAVVPGFFADGLVEIQADGIVPGDQVVVP